ncbi:MAG: competence/damage-inducible protein A [Flavobacteriales bacterium]|nr:competence/damage-inducible protein A [Flavobacteriales bacterium]
MNCEVISIGDELLIGQTVNTNASWIGMQLNLIGFDVNYGVVIPDDKSAILNALKISSERSDLVVVTGGLGPTKDDITKHTLCEFFQTTLELNHEIEDDIITYFSARGLPILQTNRDQALLPKNCKILNNSKGTASGMWFDKEQTVFISLPGVPYEMKAIMLEEVLPNLRSSNSNASQLINKTVKTHGMGESFLAEIIKDWEEGLSDDKIKLAYLPSPGIVKLRLTISGSKKERLNQKLDYHIDKLKALIPKQIFGLEKDTMEAVVGNLLIEASSTVSTAESCTGGSVAKLLTSISGSSAYFNGSVVTYSNKSKEELLNVDSMLIEKEGAVSQKVVEKMAKQVRNIFHSDFGVSTSGIAGPGGGSIEKPVGTVWIAVASKNKVVSKKLNLGYSRERNIHVSALSALNLLRLELVNN